ncbi:hypothetical protein B0H16DRAFT_1886878 [Mycena metata]|uniref:E3 ubiquitin-protein ligase listerin n=1 Tax=Mycena metata TaxID=1033252 RepID=A0AAD7J2R7_9AGAR|nr:hypothetical protein B0H16DRAFT_1886878 [Mycena metata]
MPPKSSSASSGTRKKHARKAAGPDAAPPPKQEKKDKKKHRSDPPRQKAYIPPVKPTAAPDPIEAYGLAGRVAPELVVVLRSLGKKALVTKVRALEELGVNNQDEDTLLAIAPVWLHHLPAHLVHPARRVRLLTAQIHAALLARPLLHPLLIEDAPSLARCAWVLAAHDVDRGVAGVAAAARVPSDAPELLAFLESALLTPDVLYAQLNPQPVHLPERAVKARPTGVAPQPQRSERGKSEEGDESAGDRRARIRIAALGALKWVLETSPTTPLPPFLASPVLWSALRQHAYSSFHDADDEDAFAPPPAQLAVLPSWSVDPVDGKDTDANAEEEDVYTAYLRASLDSASASALPLYSPDKTTSTTEGDAEADEQEERDTLPLGRGQPALRRAAWALVPVLLATTTSNSTASSSSTPASSSSAPASTVTTTQQPGSNNGNALPPALLLTLARALLPAAWAEPDVQTRGALWGAVCVFLRANPSAWLLAPPAPPHGAYAAFRAFLARGCAPLGNTSTSGGASGGNAGGGSPEGVYGAVVVLVAGLPWEILTPLHTLFDAFWGALGGVPYTSTSTAPPATTEISAQTQVGSPPAPALTTALPAARARACAAFVGAVLECAVFVVRRGRARGNGSSSSLSSSLSTTGSTASTAASSTGSALGSESQGSGEEGESKGTGEAEAGAEGGVQGEAGAQLFAQEVARVWGALGGDVPYSEDGTKDAKDAKKEVKPLLHVDARRAAGLVRGALGAAGGVGGDLLAAGLTTLSACLSAGGPPALVCAVLEALVGVEDDAATTAAAAAADTTELAQETESTAKLPPALVSARIRAAGLARRTEVLRGAVEREDAALLVRALTAFGGGEGVWGGEVGEALDALLATRAYALLLTAPALLLSYLAHRTPQRQALFRALLQEVARRPEAAVDALRVLVGGDARAAVAGLTAVDPSSPTASGPLDALFAAAPVPPTLLAEVLQRAELFLSPAAGHAALARVVASFAARVESALAAAAASAVPLAAFGDDLRLLASVLAGRADALRGEDARALMPAVWVFGYLVPYAVSAEEREGGEGEEVVGVARNIWLQWRDDAQSEREEVVREVKRRLGVLVCSTDVCVSPENILDALAEGTLGPVDVIAEVFPARAQLDAMLDGLPADPAAASLAVLHPHLPPASAIRKLKPASAHDNLGYSAYARIVTGLLQALSADRRAAKTHVWALRHVMALAIVAEDLRAVPAATSAMFDAGHPALDLGELEALGARAQQLTTYLLTAAVEDGWRARVLAAVTNDKPLVGGGAVPGLLVELVGCARRTDGSRECRVLERVLAHALQDADRAEADLWMAFARKIEKSAPETCIAIVSAISASTLEPPRLERYRNELAADLLGVAPSKANTQGLLTLRKLAASAPGVESDVVFLPQQRSVNIFKACQQWIASDEDIEEEVESAMTLVFFHLAPLLQNVPGTHWDLIFDVLESNLENAALTDDDTLVSLARTLRLIILIQDLALTNKTLRASWEERQMQILTMVRDLAAGQLDDVPASTPRSTCRELVLSIVQDLPASLITEDTLPKMCHLLGDPSADVQKMAYQLLTVAARKRTEHFVIEAGVDVDAVVKADLPLELLDILQTSLNLDQGDLLDLDESVVFGYLLGWMVVFDLFVDASLKVRLSYIDQLRTLDIIGTSFLPNLLSLLGVDQGIAKAFKLDVWTVDEYLVPLYESGSSWSLRVLAAHLYYRALLTVPSLIYNWVLDCKDRQLSSSIATYTSLHFSPVIIRAELAHVKSPEATAELVDDNLTIKVATAVNEVVASYLVDEHQLEIKLKIPSDWPLHKIEVKDVQRVGVEETRWRAWILAVQQTLWSQNGRIVDGIGLFKKNVTLHFEGQVECAICYSIISVMDGSLPRKPCKTCKNRFHSGCLYKWFSTSHSSSCPLCRSDII